MAIRNVIFDVGNVIVPWDPEGIERAAFGDERVSSPDYVSPLRGNPLWLAINRGEHSLAEAKELYVVRGILAADDVDRLYTALFDSMTLMEDTFTLMRELQGAEYRLFAITDNVREVVAYQKEVHEFWDLFEEAAVSAELGVLKPDPKIYNWLLLTAEIESDESVFMDDVQRNVDGAKAVGMESFVFTDAAAARVQLADLGVRI